MTETKGRESRIHAIAVVLALSFTLVMAIALQAVPSHAATIDFETVPGGVPSDQLAISNQYEAMFGVTFGLDTDGDGLADALPHLEATGGSDPGTAFTYDTLGLEDTAASGLESLLGEFFLRFGTETSSVAPAPSLIISYTTPVDEASAQIWDIDGGPAMGTEQWLVEALNGDSSVVASVTSPLGDMWGPGTRDGRPWTWVFARPEADIHEIRIFFQGSKTTKIGLAFDNFSPAAIPTSIPTLSQWGVIAFGMLLLTATAWALRRRQALDEQGEVRPRS